MAAFYRRGCHDIRTGYYLGTRLVRFMMETNSFDNIIQYRLDKVKEECMKFSKEYIQI